MINMLRTHALRIACSMMLSAQKHPVFAYLYTDGSEAMTARYLP